MFKLLSRFVRNLSVAGLLMFGFDYYCRSVIESLRWIRSKF